MASGAAQLHPWLLPSPEKTLWIEEGYRVWAWELSIPMFLCLASMAWAFAES
jgi:hypothetical protein